MSVRRESDGSLIVTAHTEGPWQSVKITPCEQGVIVVSGSGDTHIFDTVPALLDSDAAIELGEALCAMAVEVPNSPRPDSIVCRARRSDACYQGRSAKQVYGSEGMAGDGTYDGTSVICDACYIAMGNPTHAELKEQGL